MTSKTDMKVPTDTGVHVRRRVIVLAIVLTTTATAVAAEMALRVYQKVRFGIPMTAFLPNLRERQFVLSPFLVFGPRTDWYVPWHTTKENAYFNRQGFRTPRPIGAKATGEYRIIALGGSTTEDIWNSEGIHWPLIAECHLRRKGRHDVRVLNAGMSGYSTAHLLVRLGFDLVQYRPDMILVMENINDLTVNYTASLRGKPLDANYLVKYGEKAYTGARSEEDVVISRLLRAVRARMPGVRDDSAATWASQDVGTGRALFQRNLRSIAAVARAHGITPVLVTQPAAASDSLYTFTEQGFRRGLPQVGPLPPDRMAFMRDFDSYNEAAISVAAESSIPVVPMHRLMRSEDEYFVDVVHYSSRGSRLFGETVAEALFPLLPTARNGPRQAAAGSCP
jgi:lysophospholipase L1-like esterase